MLKNIEANVISPRLQEILTQKRTERFDARTGNVQCDVATGDITYLAVVLKGIILKIGSRTKDIGLGSHHVICRKGQ